MKPPHRYLLVACLAFVLGSAFGGNIALRYSAARLQDLKERLDALDVPKVIRFDVFATPDAIPAPPTFKVTLAVLPHEGEAMSVHWKGESRTSLIVCTPDGALNPCGPDGVRPDDFGAVVSDDLLSHTDDPARGDESS